MDKSVTQQVPESVPDPRGMQEDGRDFFSGAPLISKTPAYDLNSTELNR